MSKYLQLLTAGWITQMFGRPILMDRQERAKRVLEEALELAQAEGISQGEAWFLLNHVFERPKGHPLKEGAQIQFCLWGWAEAAGVDIEDIARHEIDDAFRPERMLEIKDKVKMKHAKGITKAS